MHWTKLQDFSEIESKSIKELEKMKETPSAHFECGQCDFFNKPIIYGVNEWINV